MPNEINDKYNINEIVLSDQICYCHNCLLYNHKLILLVNKKIICKKFAMVNVYYMTSIPACLWMHSAWCNQSVWVGCLLYTAVVSCHVFCILHGNVIKEKTEYFCIKSLWAEDIWYVYQNHLYLTCVKIPKQSMVPFRRYDDKHQ